MATGRELLWGRHTVLEALRAGRPLNRVHVLTSGEGLSRELFELLKEAAIPVVRCGRPRLDFLSGGANHQGIVAQVASREFAKLETVLEKAGQPLLLLALEGVQDPGNLGALIRSAEGAGAHGLVITGPWSCGLTPVVSKTSAGADAFLPVARVERLERSLRELVQSGVAVVGAVPGAPLLYHQADFKGPLVLVLGGEGEGLSERVAGACSQLVSLPTVGRVASLNVAAAGAVLLYEALRQRQI